MFGCLRIFVIVIAAALLVAAYRVDELPRIGAIALPALVLWTVPGRFWGIIRNRVHYGFAFRFWRRDYRAHFWQWLNRGTCYLLIAVCETLAIPSTFLPSSEYQAFLALTWGSAAGLLALELVPSKNVSNINNFLFFCCGLFLAVQLFRALALPVWSEKIVLATPVQGEWMVLQGGRSSLFNHHFKLQSQRHALDLLKYEDGLNKRGDSDELTSYFAYNQPLFAPSSGTVVAVVDYLPDQRIHTTNDKIPVGNHVVIELGQSRYVLLAHLLPGSVRVRKGQSIKVGQFVGRCGNSGNTTLPHLHIQVQSHADWQHPKLRTFPMYFRDVKQVRWGITWDQQHGELMRNDRIIAHTET